MYANRDIPSFLPWHKFPQRLQGIAATGNFGKPQVRKFHRTKKKQTIFFHKYSLLNHKT